MTSTFCSVTASAKGVRYPNATWPSFANVSFGVDIEVRHQTRCRSSRTNFAEVVTFTHRFSSLRVKDAEPTCCTHPIHQPPLPLYRPNFLAASPTTSLRYPIPVRPLHLPNLDPKTSRSLTRPTLFSLKAPSLPKPAYPPSFPTSLPTSLRKTKLILHVRDPGDFTTRSSSSRRICNEERSSRSLRTEGEVGGECHEMVWV